MYVPYERNKYTYDVSGPNVKMQPGLIAHLHVRSKFKGGYKLHQAEVKNYEFALMISKQSYTDLKEYWDYQRLLEYNKEKLKDKLQRVEGKVFSI